MKAFTYILRCADGSYYIGWTNDIDNRIKAHNSGKGAKYTRGRLPVELVYFEEHEDYKTAMSRECELKRLTRKQKENLISKIKNAPA